MMPDQQPPAAAVTDEGIQPFSTRPSSNWGGEGCPPASHDGLIVQCLGPLRIWINGRELGFLSNRGARSVFKYLLLYRGRPTPKEQLMHLLWPSATPAAARNNLNVAVHRLRRFLSEDERARMVVYRQNGYELDPTLPVWLDLDAFLNHAAAARECARADDRSGELRELRAAEELYGGPLYEDDRYEEWIFGRRRMALDQYVDVLDVLARRYRDTGDFHRSVDAARKILDVQPAHEIAHRTLMSTYAQLGQHHLAMRQFEDCVHALRAELDLTPGPETMALFARIRAGRSGQAPTTNGSLRANE